MGNLPLFTSGTLTYDAENRITSASQTGIGSMYYLYDGTGRRVQEVSTYNVEKVFVYDAFGQMAAKYSLGAQSLPCTTCYIATDHLGSTRMVTDQNANVVGRHDYPPFGEEIAANTGGRNGLFGTQDFVNQKFTGQERDVETGLDFFQARYFSAALGRFNSPDPGNAGADLFNPQSWNGYTYVTNNPLTFIDPSGTSPFDWSDPSPDDPCADDPFICGGPRFPGPDFPLPWPSEQPQAPPPPPPPPASIVIPHTGGSYAQGQWRGFVDQSASTGNGPFFNITLADPFWIVRLMSLPYLDLFDPNHRLFGTHYCGPGGGGNSTGKLDNACIAHDMCYANAGLSAGDNVNSSLPTGKTSALQHCNQQFCNTLKEMRGVAPAAARDYFRIIPRNNAECHP